MASPETVVTREDVELFTPLVLPALSVRAKGRALTRKHARDIGVQRVVLVSIVRWVLQAHGVELYQLRQLPDQEPDTIGRYLRNRREVCHADP